MSIKSPFMTSYKSKRILYIFVILLLIISIGQKANSQTQTPENSSKESFRTLFTQANLMMNENYTDSALQTFLLLYAKEPDNANICYYVGQLYLLTDAHKAQALPYLEKAALHVDSKYHPDDAFEKNAPPPAYYYLARAQHLNYDFDGAIANFNKFKALLPKDDKRQKDIDYWISCCNNAKTLMQTPVDCKVVNLGDSINTTYSEYSPIISADEQELLFTRKGSKGDTERDIYNNLNQHIWMAEAHSDRTWGTAHILDQTVNSAGSEVTISLSPDGYTMIFYKYNSDNSGGTLNVSYYRGSLWSSTAALDSSTPELINATSLQPSACISPDQRTIYFSSNRAGGQGGTDIYRIDMGATGAWSNPINLGPSVNTEYDEDYPFIHPDDSTMFFSSKGHNTMGGYDVFSAKETAGQWGDVKNIGYPVNTPDDDTYFKLSADGRRAYYSSVRKDTRGEKDIYEVFFNKPLPVQPIAVLVGYIKNPNGGQLPSDMTISTGPANGTSMVTTSVNYQTGKFLEVMRPGQNYRVEVKTQGKVVFDHNFYLSPDSSYSNLERAFFRTPIILGDTTNVFVAKPKTIAATNTTNAVATGNMMGKLLLNDDPMEPLSKLTIRLEDANGKEVQKTTTGTDGSFSFNGLPADNKYNLVVDTKGTSLKHLNKLLLLNTNGQEVRNYDINKKKLYYFSNLPVDLNKLQGKTPPETTVATTTNKNTTKTNKNTSKNTTTTSPADGNAAFVRYFGYNMDDVSMNDNGFDALINKLAGSLSGGNTNITIEASASTVPTKIFHASNKALAAKRAKVAKAVILKALKNKNVDTSKLTVEVNSSVQGPEYEHDAKTDESKYQKYQYVKVYIR